MSGEEAPAPAPAWGEARERLRQTVPAFYELEPGGALALQLGGGEWILEVTPDGRLICQTGMEIEDIQRLLSEGTPEDLGTDELAKQAKYYLQPIASKFRQPLVEAGFEEQTEMNDQFVAVTFHRMLDFRKFDEVAEAIRWCRSQFKKPGA